MPDAPARSRVSVVTAMMLIVAAMLAFDVVQLFIREHRVRPFSAVMLVLFLVIAYAAQRTRK